MNKMKVTTMQWSTLLIGSLVLSNTGGALPPTLSELHEKASASLGKATTYIKSQQNKDGGFSLLPGGPSGTEETAWAILALATLPRATGLLSDRSWRNENKETLDILYHAFTWLKSQQDPNGDFDGNTAHTAFAVLASATLHIDSSELQLRAKKWLQQVQQKDSGWSRTETGESMTIYTGLVSATHHLLEPDNERNLTSPLATQWLVKSQNKDGGWGMKTAKVSSTAATAWALLGFSHLPHINETYHRGKHWLLEAQNNNGGFGIMPDAPSDPELTAYVLRALIARCMDEDALRQSIVYLIKTQEPDGAWASMIPIELKEPHSNLQTTCFCTWALADWKSTQHLKIRNSTHGADK